MSIYDGLKDAAGVLKEAGKIPEYRQILEALEKMLDLQKKNTELEKEVTDLKEKLRIKNVLVIKNHAYWYKETGEGPFCTRCWDSESKPIHMHPNGNPSFYSCPNCKSGSVKAKPELDDDRPRVMDMRDSCQ